MRADQAGQASGATNAIRELGGVLGIAVLATVFTSHGGYASPQAFVDGLIPAMWVGVGGARRRRADRRCCSRSTRGPRAEAQAACEAAERGCGARAARPPARRRGGLSVA